MGRWTLTMVLLGVAGCTGREGAVQETGDSSVPEPTPFECTYVSSQEHGVPGEVGVEVQVVASGLATPWGVDWLPNGDLIITERDGVLSRVSSGVVTQIATVDIHPGGEGGLLGIAVDPNFAMNRSVYLYYTAQIDGKTLNRVARWVLSEDGLGASEAAVVVDNIEARRFHNGGRLRIGPDGYLYIGTGDAGEPELSQDPQRLAGKILRVALDGSVPVDNPFPNSLTWVYGIRNTQGFDWIDGGRMLVSDHGPSGLSNEGGRTDHDEVSVAAPGDNLGWPESYACEEGAEQVTASITWANAMPPGGAAIYRGTEIPEWSGDLMIGVLGFADRTPHLHRLGFDPSGNVTVNEVYLHGDAGYGRLRDVVMGPDGGLYVTTSNCDGRGTCGEGDRILRIGSK